MLRHWKIMVVILFLLAAGYGVSISGCSKDDLTEAFDKAKDAVGDTAKDIAQEVENKVADTTDQVEKELNLAGNFDLTARTPLKTKACYISWLPQGQGRQTVLQLQSYRDADDESFPSAFLQAHVQANSLADLGDEPIPARLFLQRDDEGTILFSDAPDAVEIKITAVEENSVSFELIHATLRDSSSGDEVEVTGTMTGVLE